jgi:signal transduction histidine kinase/CheY-like chemotaxis protein
MDNESAKGPGASVSDITGMDTSSGPSEQEGADISADNPLATEKRGSGSRLGQEASSNAREEIDRLRAAMNAQLQLHQYREKLARQLLEQEGRDKITAAAIAGKARVSPIHEEEAISSMVDAAFETPLPSGLETTSTESAKTIRGGGTPAVAAMRTPSYPFPPMRTPGPLVFSAHRPFTTLSPTVNPTNYAGGSFEGPIDSVMSGSVTPASTLNFKPGSHAPQEDPNFETPNLYDLSLMLSSEPGLDPWWTTVVQVMRDIYKSDRVTLSVPADSTDVENVPWGQKATFNSAEEDELSVTYLPRGSSLFPSSGDTNETSNSDDGNADENTFLYTQFSDNIRPGLVSRHSFTAYEDTKREPISFSESSRATVQRPSPLPRAKSYLSARPDPHPRPGTLQNAQLNLQSLKYHMEYEEAKSTNWENYEGSSREVRGRVFSVLQALNYEVDPLIDSSGVLRVLERGKVIALTRNYPYLEIPSTDDKISGSSTSQRSGKPRETPAEKLKKGKAPELVSRISSFLGGRSSRRACRSARFQTADKGRNVSTDDAPVELPRYEEYEQSPLSPWAQSPAPSPAVRAETGENPFFSNTTIDEETFNPNVTTQDYDKEPLEAIGVDRSWTVLHIPLFHPLLSKPVQSFRLDATAMELKSAGRGRGNEPSKEASTGKPPATDPIKDKKTPIAILSILSPVTPYPSNLRHSLEHLSPHLATSFSLCRHYSNLEHEIAGLSRKRPQTAGFGAVAHSGRTYGEFASSPVDESVPHQSMAGSLTSPSDYSGVSRSATGSPAGTPGWDPGSVGLTLDKQSSGGSPNLTTAESYFASRSKQNLGRIDAGSVASIAGVRQTSKETALAESRSQALRGVEKFHDAESTSKERRDDRTKNNEDDLQSATSTPRQDPRPGRNEVSEHRDISPSHQILEAPLSPRRQAIRTASNTSNYGQSKTERAHTQLHSYGADFGATFQSLPTTSVQSARAAAPGKSHSRSGSMSIPTDMPPPSDRLKGLMLDSLPAHVFVALPQTGEIVWVNNRYLTYRGQTVPELYADPWGSIHPEEREGYLKAWSHAVRTGEQFSKQVRIRRFDGTYRWFYTRAVGSRDIRGVIVQWYGSHMDIHEQHIAELKAARQEEVEASEAKHRQLANLIPQIIFSATEDEGVNFCNEQWLSYTGQTFDDAMGLGFMDYIHPEDLAKCHIPIDRPPTPYEKGAKKRQQPTRQPSQSSSGGNSSSKSSTVFEAPSETTLRRIHQTLSRNNSSSNGSVYDLPTADLAELAKQGIVKVSTDANGRLYYTTEVRLRNKDGQYRWHLVRCVEVDNISFGSGDGSWFGACTDINDHKLLEAKLKEAMESKGKFLSNMSHEIRTPLIGISGMVSFLQDTPLNDEQTDYTNTIQASASSLLNIINDILDLSKVDAGMMKLSHEWFHTRSLVEEVNEMVSTMAITKSLELNYVIDRDVPEMVKGDKFRIRQVLLNVVGNAIKFTTVGEVFSRCRVYRAKPEEIGENEIMLEYSVIDTGSGFTQEEADMIFKPFSQIDGSSTRQHGGSGLGLVISRQLVEIHGGKMEGSSIPGKGSTFVFTAKFGLPTLEDHPELPCTPQLSKSPSQTSSISSSVLDEVTARAMRQAAGNPILANKLMYSPLVESPRTASSSDSPALVSSSGSGSEPSLHSTRSNTRSSSSSVAQSLAHFSAAARAGASELAQMKLELPDWHPPAPSTVSTHDELEPTAVSSLGPTPTAHTLQRSASPSDLKHFRPPIYSILIICPQTHSREATTQHIENTLPKDVPHQITPLSSVAEAQKMIGGEDPVIFTHIVLNLPSAEEIVIMVEQILNSISLPHTSIVVLSDPVQRQEVTKMATAYDYEQLAKDNQLTFIYKPVKPSRFAVIFDPDKERDLSTDRNKSSAQQQVASQKQAYVDVGKRLGNKGLKVLLVEDNTVNQKVLMKYLSKVGIDMELAQDGQECTEKVFAQPHSTYSLILVGSLTFLPTVLNSTRHASQISPILLDS